MVNLMTLFHLVHSCGMHELRDLGQAYYARSYGMDRNYCRDVILQVTWPCGMYCRTLKVITRTLNCTQKLTRRQQRSCAKTGESFTPPKLYTPVFNNGKIENIINFKFQHIHMGEDISKRI